MGVPSVYFSDDEIEEQTQDQEFLFLSLKKAKPLGCAAFIHSLVEDIMFNS